MSSPRKWMRNLIWPLVSASMLTSCASLTQIEPVQYPPLDPSLTQPCPPLAPVADGKAATLARALIDDAQAYRACADRHRRLVEVAQFRRTLKEIEHAQ